MKTYIIDASVLLRGLLNEGENIANKLQELFKQVEKKHLQIYSSTLLPLEVANGLRYSITDKNLSEKTFTKFGALPILYFSFKPEHVQKALDLSYELKTSVYDTSYHVLAKLLSGIFLTCDKEYWLKAKDFASIELLS